MIDLKHRLEWVDPASLADHPRNWKTHPPDQLGALAGVIADVGQVVPLIANVRTGNILDGHGRKQLAIAERWAAVLVCFIDCPAEHEAKILATIDTIGQGADTDAAALVELLREVETSSIELQSFLAGIGEELMGAFDDGDDATEGDDDPAEDSPAEEEDVPESPAADILWPSGNELGIPDLLPGLQADGVVFPATLWGTVGKAKSMPGTWVAYTRDDRLERLWYDPTGLLESRPAAAIEPNFSTHPQMPRAVVIWATYRKRWIARFWQSRGVRVFVDLSVAPEWAELNLAGVPKGWRSYATRAHADGGGVEAIEEHHRIAVAHAGTDQITFVVYGGWKSTRELCAARGWAWIPEQLHKARGEDMPALPEVADGSR